MLNNRIWTYTALAALAIPAAAAADDVRLQKDDVIPVIFQTELNFRNTHEGDHFKADVADSHMLPWGARLEGVVNRIEQKHGSKPGFMDIEFTDIVMPDGHRTSFHGTPISLGKDYVTRDRYGRWEAKKGVSKDTVVLGSIAGGLVLGSLIKKPFEGAFVGAILGVLGAETDKQHVADGNIVIPKGTRVGARVDEDLVINFNGSWDNRGSNDDYGSYDRDGYNSAGYDRYGYDRDGHYNPRYDAAKGGDRDDTKDGYDKYGYDRDGHYNPRYDTTRDSRGGTRDGGYNSDGYDKYGYDRDGHYNPRYDTTRDPQGRDSQSRPVNDKPIDIEVDRKALRYASDERPYRSGWIVMVPLESTAEQLGLTSSRTGSGNFRIESENDVLTVEQDSRTYSLNGRRGSLPAEAEVRGGVTYVPIDAFTKLTRGSVYVNGAKYRPQS